MTGTTEKPNMPTSRQDDLSIGGTSVTRIVLWLGAITIVSFLIGFGILALSGGFPPSGDHRFSPFKDTAFRTSSTTSVPLEGATLGDVSLTLGAGKLRVQGGAPDNALMDAKVFTKAPEWEPDLVQNINGSVKSVVMTEKGHTGKEWFAVDSPNSWSVSLTGQVPIRLDVNVGAGDCTLDLGALTVESLAVHTGAGDTTIILGRNPGVQSDAEINVGIGDLTLRVPRDSNTRIQVELGIGDISNNGLVQDGDIYVTEGFNPAVAVNEITLNQGVGSINLETV